MTAQRVVAGQRLMQAASDIFLGWNRVENPAGRVSDFYVRQLQDWKASANIEQVSPEGNDQIWPDVRLDTRPRTRPLRRPDCDRFLPGLRRRV